MDGLDKLTQKMQTLESRLARIEKHLFEQDPANQSGSTQEKTSHAQPNGRGQNKSDTPGVQYQDYGYDLHIAKTDAPLSTSKIMAWCAGITFILAAVYFLKLVYDTGWLTPVRQIAIAYLSGIALIVGSFYFDKKDKQYAAYLPAVGLVVLYLTTFVAHLNYGFYTHGPATALVAMTTLLGIWLSRRFNNSVYLIFSEICIYASPFLIQSDNPQLLDLVIYYSAWSLLFSYCSLLDGRRITYLLPMYLAILGFDLIWRGAGGHQWQLAAGYQLVQFVIFAGNTILFSLYHKSPIEKDTTLAHGVALFMFYGIEYAILAKHIPDLVNYFALGSGVLVWFLYYCATRFYQGKEAFSQGAVLVSYYCSWVVVHAVFLSEIPGMWLPWSVLSMPFVYVLLNSRLRGNQQAAIPVMLACGGLFLLGYGMLLRDVLLNTDLKTPMPIVALFVYVALLYGMYWFATQREQFASNEPVENLKIESECLHF
ncbi:hypothetical protein GCM10023116_20060 [Kistimonas scapharcae]|uniref:DUF2339 domain-containing protein n=1 Tax=Kistimonas scapharcae TaxID=1036133 RepID=A0ABP8V1R8_9GAMM